MSENIILAYNEKKIEIKVPKDYDELKKIFLKIFKVGENQNFYFSYLSFIDKDIDFKKVKNNINENYKPIINVFKEKDKEEKSEEVIVGMSLESFLKKQKKLRKKNNKKLKLNNELKNINNGEEVKSEDKRVDNEKNIFIKQFKNENNLAKIELQPLKELVNDAYNFDCLINAFCVFKAFDEMLYIVYTTRFKSIISFNIINDKKIKEIKNAHNNNINNFRHCSDQKNKIDLIISISSQDNNVKLWNFLNMELLYNFEEMNDSGSLKSACFINDNNQIYLVISNSNNFDKVKPIKIFDLRGNQVKEINNSKDDTYFVDSFYDEKISKNFIITGNYYDVKSYDYNENNLYFKYFDHYSKYHYCVTIKYEDKIIKLIETSKDGNLRIWDFHSGKLLNKIQVSNNRLFDICIWSDKYALVGCGEEIIKLIDLNLGKKVKTLHDFNSVISIKKINHPQFGECIITQGNEIEQIILWVKKD